MQRVRNQIGDIVYVNMTDRLGDTHKVYGQVVRYEYEIEQDPEYQEDDLVLLKNVDALYGLHVGSHQELLFRSMPETTEEWADSQYLNTVMCFFCESDPTALAERPANTFVWQEAMGDGEYLVPCCLRCLSDSIPKDPK